MANLLKVALRNSMKQVRSKLSTEFRLKASRQICNRITTLKQYQSAKRIGLYSAINGEIDLNTLWKNAPMQGKFCYFPALNDDLTLSFLPATPKTAFIENRYGILEPDVSREEAISVDDLDLIIIPLVAFDSSCNRLGMGAGYYDRTLEHKKKVLLLGVAYPFQRIDYIEPQPWDVPLDAVITPREIHWRNDLLIQS